MQFRLINAGSFWMGDSLENSMPIHKVTISKPFYIGVYEVTRDQYNEIMKTVNYDSSNSNRPAAVTWNEANEFCKRLSEITKDKYRLPTEAEWEYAARGGLDREKYVWGDNEIPIVNGINQANVPDESLKKINPKFNTIQDYNDGFAELSPVGSFAPNGYGLYDMAGNAWERCSDYYESDYYERSPELDPIGPTTGQQRVMRGGGYLFGYAERLRVAYRCGSPVDRCGSNDGFRVVREIEGE